MVNGVGVYLGLLRLGVSWGWQLDAVLKLRRGIAHRRIFDGSGSTVASDLLVVHSGQHDGDFFCWVGQLRDPGRVV